MKMQMKPTQVLMVVAALVVMYYVFTSMNDCACDKPEHEDEHEHEPEPPSKVEKMTNPVKKTVKKVKNVAVNATNAAVSGVYDAYKYART